LKNIEEPATVTKHWLKCYEHYTNWTCDFQHGNNGKIEKKQEQKSYEDKECVTYYKNNLKVLSEN
jgi:hypothetical protein